MASRLLSILDKRNIYFDTLLHEAVEDNDIKRFIGFFSPVDSANVPSHAVILSPLSTRWFDFLAGFSCGSPLNLLVFGQEAITGISKEFAFCYSFFDTEESLNTFFEAEYEAFQKQETAREIIRSQETLLKMGIPVTAESLSHCAGTGQVSEVTLFLAAGFSPNTRNKAGVPLIHMAARNGNREVLQYLISVGAQLDLKSDDRGSSALIDATMAKQYKLVIDLIEAGADVDIKSKDGQTALIIAAGGNDEKNTESLLKAGADPDVADSLGASARKYAALFRQKAMIELFEKYAPS